MKLIAAAACLLFVTTLAQAQTAPAAKPAPATPAVKPASGKAKAAKPEAKKEEELPKIPGVEIARANGTFLGLEVVGTNFKLTFYDKKKKAMAMDVTRATARWPNPRSPGDNRTVLNGSGSVLVGARSVLPPYNFNVYLTLLQGEGDTAKAVESYVVSFRG